MGSYYELSVANFVMDVGKAYLPGYVFIPFRREDRVSPVYPNEEAPHVYRSNASTIARRLDLLGFSLPSARRAYEWGISRLQEWEREKWPKQLIQPGGFAAWVEAMRVAVDFARRLDHISPTDIDDERLQFMLAWEEHMFGFPSGEPLLVLRTILAAASNDDEVELDFDDLVTDGYVHEPDTLWEAEEHQPLIVVTEGKFDSRVLRDTVDLLMPELRSFVSFIDFETANAKGGTDELVQFVRMFIGCGIRNRVAVVFDNDAAGHDALQRLLQARLPSHVFAMTLPQIEHARSYPTLGPEGASVGDINGRACSIELYLGRDTLLADDGGLFPVRWTGYNEKTERYQGQINNKGLIQKRFEEKLRLVQSRTRTVDEFDFSGLNAIFESIFNAVASR
ncbi:HEPN/Toprim-associated domain-containing protein [Polyangium sp. 6x1]|uniref:HEPN/Toprim-associated domain-containing protein n=1 Tax=Polyangium sp. 6x1 TaxID=3042689 RepID=UPI002482B971|nr:HEPN/Toprim-associated domain-containing protein [Polyangium sp. 6x1]MDI1444863.1 HEPN/Toprim-associated domain-containing protein [Polyangium sp. 6x1]